MRKTILALTACISMILPAHAQLSAGSLMFVAFNADGTDGVAFAALEDVPAGTIIYFTDNEWDGSSFNTGETYWQWSSGSTLTAGSVVIIEGIDQGTLNGSSPNPTASVGSCSWSTTSSPDNNSGLSASGEAVYMYLAASYNMPTTFISAIATGNFNPSLGELTGTGLTEGVNAIQVLGNSDVIIFYTDVFGADCVETIATEGNWMEDNGSGDQSNDGNYPDFPADVIDFLGCICSCETPVGLTASAITPYSATLSWTAVAGATGYVIQYENELTGPNYRGKISDGTTSVNVGAGKIQPGNSYVWGVKARCADCYSDWSEPSYFTSPMRLAGGDDAVALIFPNPSNGQMTIQLPESNAETMIMITDLSGKMVLSQSVGAGETAVQLNIAVPGMYQVLISSNESSFIQKVIVQ